MLEPVTAELKGRPRRQGVALVLLAAVLFTVMGTLAKFASAQVPTMQLVAARSAVTWLAVELLRRRMGVPLVFHRKGALALRSAGGFVAISAYFHALRSIPLGDAVMINHSSPVLISVGAVFVLGERMTAVRAGGLAAALVGVWLLVDVGTGGLAREGALAAVVSAVASAFAVLALKVASHENRAVIIVWCFGAVSTLGALASIDSAWVTPDARETALLIGTGLAGAAAQLVSTSAMRRLDASEAVVFGYAAPLLAVVAGITVFGDRPGATTWLGGALIVASGVGVAWLGRPAAKVERTA
jgi:drug/metabolite transporter (DMT)-like permease